MVYDIGYATLLDFQTLASQITHQESHKALRLKAQTKTIPTEAVSGDRLWLQWLVIVIGFFILKSMLLGWFG